MDINNKFKTGFESIDRKIVFSPTDLICVAGRPAMGCTTFALNMMQKNNNSKGCLISLVDTSQQMQKKMKMIIAGQTTDDRGLSKTKEIDLKFLELPSTLELIEFIVTFSSDYDYFIIDELSYINQKTNPIFSQNKDYQEVVRHLKSICLLMKKNIILLSSISSEIEDESKLSFSHYGIREKYFDHIITIARPEYYGIENDESGRDYEKGETIVCIAKTQLDNVGFETSLIFDSKNLAFEMPVFAP